MSKRNITYIKPEVPKFLQRIKEQVGYKEGPTVDTKREALDIAEPDDFEDSEDEQPTVVVLNSEHLTAEEAAEVKKRLDQEKEETPADLNERVIFKVPSKNKEKENSASEEDKAKSSTEKKFAEDKFSEDKSEKSTGEKAKKRSSSEKSDKKTKKQKSLLSFDEEENDDF